jgi:XTP/dITP diphosphohydrolase
MTAALAFVTSNPHKFREAERVLKGFGVNIRHAKLSYPEIRGDDPAEIAADSVRKLKDKVKPPFFVEDTGLFVEGLNGFPGAYAAWALRKIGLQGLLRLMKGEKNRKAAFRTAVALYDGKRAVVFTGEAKGSIATAQKGKGGFGYDPVFVPRGSRKSFAQMSSEEKDALSHRRNALVKLANYWRK